MTSNSTKARKLDTLRQLRRLERLKKQAAEIKKQMTAIRKELAVVYDPGVLTQVIAARAGGLSPDDVTIQSAKVSLVLAGLAEVEADVLAEENAGTIPAPKAPAAEPPKSPPPQPTPPAPVQVDDEDPTGLS